MIALFKQKSPANIVLLLIFGLLIKLPLFLYPKVALATSADGKLYHLFVSLISRQAQSNEIAAAFLSFSLLYVQSLMINYIINEYRMTARQTFLPGMAYLLITSLLPDWNYLSAALVSSTLIIWSFSSLLRLYNVASANERIYNIGLVIGLSSFIYFPSIFLGLCILLGLMILRPFRLNELFLFLLGIITPYYFYTVYLFLTDSLTLRQLIPPLQVKFTEFKSSIWITISTVLIGIPFLMGGYYVQTHLHKMLIQARQSWGILLIYLLPALFIPLINAVQSFANWSIVIAPFAAFHACTYLYPPRKWVSLFLFLITVGYILVQQFATPAWH